MAPFTLTSKLLMLWFLNLNVLRDSSQRLLACSITPIRMILFLRKFDPTLNVDPYVPSTIVNLSILVRFR